MIAPLLRTENISKDFGGGCVLNGISLDLFRGETLGIVGENGAGKSTLVKILTGIHQPSEGRLLVEGQPVHLRSPSAAKHLGIVMIPQEFNLIADLNVYENIFLGNEFRGRLGLLDRTRMIRQARQILEELQTPIDPAMPIARLSVAQKQMVEIAKAFAHDCRLLILDEPTTVLSRHEIDVLFALMARLKAKGVSLIYISHKLGEVCRVCDRVLVLRDGNMISLTPAHAVDEHTLARHMVGRELSQFFPEKTTPAAETALRVEGLSVPGVLDDISFELRRGEILGFAGLVGAGRTELAETLIGLRRPRTGCVRVGDREVSIRCPADAIRCGITYLPEDRQGAGILSGFDIPSNVTLSSLRRYSRGLINRRAERAKAREYVARFRIKAASLSTRLEFLSGGNQQKVSLAKSLDPEPRVLIVDEPTRGIDINAKTEIYAFLHDLAATGVACILISSELEEIIGMCNRVLVMRGGRLNGLLEGSQISEEEIICHATGLA